jgi:hypothetical protein
MSESIFMITVVVLFYITIDESQGGKCHARTIMHNQACEAYKNERAPCVV